VVISRALGAGRYFRVAPEASVTAPTGREVDHRSRIRGCLLAGAVGDALGAPVEFDSLARIQQTYGLGGISELSGSSYGRPGLVTDDTQMVLFTVEALLAVDDPLHESLYAAYQRWLVTQQRAAPPAGATGLAAQPWLYAARAPGNACLSGLRAAHRGTVASPVNAGSKGCGTVMRSAPFGLSFRLTDAEAVADAAITGAALTHGHPTALLASAGLAVIVHHLAAGRGLLDAVSAAIDLLSMRPHHHETTEALQRAVNAAAQEDPSPAHLSTLGQGWVAEEALAMSVYSALAYPGPHQMREALILAVNHDGDSDSTGAITGNLLGALHGEAAIPDDWAEQVEGRETILALADRLAEPAPPRVLTLTVHDADPVQVHRFERLSRVRGMLLGLALGDALIRPGHAGGVLRGTSTSQLACFTVEGLIRAWVRGENRGVCHPPSIVWNAYRRWATIQGIDLSRNTCELDGWLHRVPALHERRGNAPAMVAALKATPGNVPVPAPTASRGHHALTRLLPVAGLTSIDTRMVEEMAGATHGDPDTVDAAVIGVSLAHAALTSESLAEAMASVPRNQSLAVVLEDSVPLSLLAPDHSARSALQGGAALAARCTGPAMVEHTLTSARSLAAPDAVGPVAGALIGALYGAEALPIELLARMELGWTMDTLARDLISQLYDQPSGTEYSAASDPHWHDRYPSA
jgi:ADP-ribosylglycohydrolase